MVCYNYTDLVTKREVARNIQLIEQNYPVEDWGKKAGHCKECFENIEGIREHRNYQIVQVTDNSYYFHHCCWRAQVQ